MDRQAALEHEAQRFSEMAATPESESLIGLFEGSTALKKNRFGKPAKKVGTNTHTNTPYHTMACVQASPPPPPASIGIFLLAGSPFFVFIM